MKAKSFKKFMALLTAITMSLGVVACGNQVTNTKESSVTTSESQATESSGVKESDVPEEVSNFNATGYPIVNEEITLKVVLFKNNKTTVDYDDMEGWKYLEKLFGVNFEFEGYNGEEIYTKMPLIMSDPDNMPDLFIQCGMTPSDLQSYGSQGLLLDMTELIEKYGENTKVAFDQDASNRAFATAADGAIYGLPSYNAGYIPSITFFYVNKRWMQNCGIEDFPANAEEFKDMLVTFKEMDANGNGDPNDEIPMMAVPAGNMQVTMSNIFGMPLDWPWVGARYGALYGTTEAVPTFMLDNYRDMIAYIHELYDEELINQDLYSVTADESKARRLSDIYGVLETRNVTAEQEFDPDEWVAMPQFATEYKKDPTEYIYMTPSFQTGMGCISGHTEYPEVCMRILDYFMSVDGTALQNGNNSTTHDLVAAGVSQEVIDILDTSLTTYGDKNTAQANTMGASGCKNATLLGAYALNSTDNLIYNTFKELALSYKDKIFYNPTHTLAYNEEEQEVVNAYYTDIDAYVIEKVSRWIVGEEELNDDTWNAYIEQLKKMHVDDLTAANVSAHNRFFGVE